MTAKLHTADYPLLNLHCAGCAQRAEGIAASQRGVKKASANFAASLLHVEYNDDFDAVSLQKAIQDAGYDLIINSPDPFAEQEKENAKVYAALKKRVLVVWILALPLMVLGMAHAWHFSGKDVAMMWLSFFILYIGGRDFIRNAFRLARQWSANMDTLVAVSTLVSFLFSVFTLCFPEFWQKNGLGSHVYFEASGMIIAFVLLGKLLEGRAKNGTSAALRELVHLQPDTAFLLTENGEKQVPVSVLRPGDRVSVHPGSQLPADGVVRTGSSYVDESMITGEPVPVLKTPESRVVAGTINQKGGLEVEITASGADTVLAGIVRMVREAQGSKAPVQRIADKVAAVFVPVILLLAALTFVLWLLIGGTACFHYALLCALSVLVIACPCALGLATPTALMVGMGRAARNHILIKDASALESLSQVDAVVMDKTGTLTCGKPVVSVYFVPENQSLGEWIGLFRAAEEKSEHPLAQAAVQWTDTLKETSGAVPVAEIFREMENLESLTGKGLQFNYRGQSYWIGGLSLLSEKIPALIPAQQELVSDWVEKAYSIVVFGKDEHPLLYLGISDEVKPCAQETVVRLQKAGVEVYMLTGDHQRAASVLASRLGIGNYEAGMLPTHKEEYIKRLQQEGRRVAMVGDGINDSQALARADVSIALKRGTDIAANVASVVLIGNEKTDIAAIPTAILLSRKTYGIIKGNLFWAFIYNVAGLVLASGLLFPFWGITLNPMIASAAMAFSSVSVVANSLRLKWVRLQ